MLASTLDVTLRENQLLREQLIELRARYEAMERERNAYRHAFVRLLSETVPSPSAKSCRRNE